MSIYNSKTANKKHQEIKNLISVMRKTVSNQTLIKEDFQSDLGVNTSNQNIPQNNTLTEPSNKTTQMAEIEKAIKNSKCKRYDSDNGEKIVEGVIMQNGKECIIFNYKSTETEPILKTIDTVYLSDELMESINQISSYYSIWKEQI
jgi:hypothetical protein